MAYLAFYRTFRPTTFDEVVRQEHIVRILKNQIETDKVGHAYLFCGPRGTGKTTLAKIFARAINCENPQNGSPCGKCPSCKALLSGGLDVTEIDAASNNGVDEMRDLREKVQYPPVSGKYKVYIIDEVHMLTASAFNAVLKTLEEPPRHAVFILATTEPQKLPATILSRCMRFDFKLIPQEDLEQLIKSVLERTGKEYEDAAVSAIARAGAGSARDSLSIADMCASYSRGKLTYADVNEVLGGTEYSSLADLLTKILRGDEDGAFSATDKIISSGKSVGVLIKDMLSFLNYCAIVKVCRTSREIINLPDETYNLIKKTAEEGDGHRILRVTEILTKAENDLRYSSNPVITLETAVLKCAMPQTDYNIDALIGRIAALEKKLEEGVAVKVVKTEPQATKPELPLDKGEENPFASQTKKEDNPFESQPAPKEKTEAVQPALWEDGAGANKPSGGMTADDKKTVFGRFIRCLRTTHKNAVLFTLCMDLQSCFEGEKLILITDNEAVYKGLSRTENAKFLADVLLSLGVDEYEVRLKAKGGDEYDEALGQLKNNFKGTDIEIK